MAVPELTNTASLTRTIIEAELAVNEYQISSFAIKVDAQEGAGAEGLAFNVVAAVGEVQVNANGLVATAIAPTHSSLETGCEIAKE